MSGEIANVQGMIDGLAPVLDQAAGFRVIADLSYSWLGQRLARFRGGEPLVEVELDQEELKMHVAGKSSPARIGEAPLTVREFVERLRALPERAESRVIHFSTSILQGDYVLTLNVPTDSVTVSFRPKTRTMVLALRAARRRSAAA